jgi:hypothetical protein
MCLLELDKAAGFSLTKDLVVNEVSIMLYFRIPGGKMKSQSMTCGVVLASSSQWLKFFWVGRPPGPPIAAEDPTRPRAFV